MTLFYAYLKDSVYDLYYRYLVVFESRDAADEWWRLVSTPPSPYAATIKRISPQFFVQSAEKGNVVTFFSNTSLVDANKFLDRMFFTLLNDRDGRVLSIPPPIKVTDHISGRWYFIRSQDDPDRHWYFRDGTSACPVCGNADCQNVHVSTNYRTRFYIQFQNTSLANYQAPKVLVLIGSDQVTIATSNDYTLRVTDGELRATRWSHAPTPDRLFLFSDLKDRFVTRVAKAGNGDISEYVKAVDRGSGEVFELSN